MWQLQNETAVIQNKPTVHWKWHKLDRHFQKFKTCLPIVGMVVTISPNFSLYKIVVFPAASRPTERRDLVFSFRPARFFSFDCSPTSMSKIQQALNMREVWSNALQDFFFFFWSKRNSQRSKLLCFQTLHLETFQSFYHCRRPKTNTYKMHFCQTIASVIT